MAKQFKKATKSQAKLRLALVGPSGSGKTYSTLKLATLMCNRVAVIDTERGSASKYADKFNFDVLELETYSPSEYIEAIKLAEKEGYDGIVIDSLSHAWMGKGGALDQVDNIAKRSQSNNSYYAWREVTPQHNSLVDAILQSKCHIFVTMRSKTEYIIEDVKGKKVPRKIGLAPIQREGVEFELDIVADMDLENNMLISKTRCEALSGQVYKKPGEDVAKIIKDWLTDGAPEEEPKPREFKEPDPPKEKPKCTPEQFEAMIAKWDAEFAATGKSNAGDFINYVIVSGEKYGLDDDLQHWPPEQYSLTKQFYSEFNKSIQMTPAIT